MKNSKFILIIFISIFGLWSCSDETGMEEIPNKLDPSKFHQQLNVSYGAAAGQKFDLYLPANRTSNTKTVILVHGGGWSSGDKNDMDYLKNFIRQDFPNLAIVNMNYRLADENNKPYPMQIDDITSVINHLKTNKEEYTISSNFGFVGVSAGAHLSLLWSYAFDTTDNINMVASVVGPTNFTDPAYLNATNTELQGMLGFFGVNPTIPFLEEISPFHQATASAPPTTLFYAENDELVPATQGTAMRDKLTSLSVTHEFKLYTGVGHALSPAAVLDIWARLKVFMQVHL